MPKQSIKSTKPKMRRRLPRKSDVFKLHQDTIRKYATYLSKAYQVEDGLEPVEGGTHCFRRTKHDGAE